MRKLLLVILFLIIMISSIFAQVNVGTYNVAEGQIVEEDLLIVGNSIIEGTVDGDLTFYGDVLEISGEIKGDLVFIGSKLHIKDFAVIGGTVDFIGDVFLIDEGADLQNGIENNVYLEEFTNFPGIQNKILAKASHFILKVFFVFFAFFIFKRFIKKMERNLVSSPFGGFLWGLLYNFLAFFVIIIFFITILGIPISLFVTLFFVVSLLFASAALYLWLGRNIVKLLGVPQINEYLAIFIGALIIFMLSLIPGFRILYYLTIYTAFMGAFFVTLFLKRGIDEVK